MLADASTAGFNRSATRPSTTIKTISSLPIVSSTVSSSDIFQSTETLVQKATRLSTELQQLVSAIQTFNTRASNTTRTATRTAPLTSKTSLLSSTLPQSTISHTTPTVSSQSSTHLPATLTDISTTSYHANEGPGTVTSSLVVKPSVLVFYSEGQSFNFAPSWTESTSQSSATSARLQKSTDLAVTADALSVLNAAEASYAQASKTTISSRSRPASTSSLQSLSSATPSATASSTPSPSSSPSSQQQQQQQQIQQEQDQARQKHRTALIAGTTTGAAIFLLLLALLAYILFKRRRRRRAAHTSASHMNTSQLPRPRPASTSLLDNLANSHPHFFPRYHRRTTRLPSPPLFAHPALRSPPTAYTAAAASTSTSTNSPTTIDTTSSPPPHASPPTHPTSTLKPPPRSIRRYASNATAMSRKLAPSSWRGAGGSGSRAHSRASNRRRADSDSPNTRNSWVSSSSVTAPGSTYNPFDLA